MESSKILAIIVGATCIFTTAAFAADGTGLTAKDMAEIAKMIMQQTKNSGKSAASSSGQGVKVESIIEAVNIIAKNKGDINSILGDGVITVSANSAAVNAVNSLTSKLYAQIAKNDSNLFFSPYSVTSALAMVYAGARGDTATQMAGALSFSPQIHSSFATLINQLNSISSDVAQIHTANALWPSADKTILNDYRNRIATDYQAEITTLNYADTVNAAKTINSWVENKTNGKIKDIVTKGTLTKDTPLALTNAIYFKSDWQSKFETHRTAKADFTLTNGKKVKTYFMNQTGFFPYLVTENFKFIELPYKTERLSMYIILPAKGKLQTVESTLTAERLNSTIAQADKNSTYLNVSIPKFKLETDYDLNDALKAIGMADAFGPKANFSGMNGKLDIAIGKVLHKTFLDVNEAGTEAAAATYVGMKSLAMRDKPQEFKADNPFIFVIRDNTSGVNLFIGRYAKP